MVAEHVAGANDHEPVLTDISGECRNEENQNKAGTPVRHESYEIRPGYVGTANLLECPNAERTAVAGGGLADRIHDPSPFPELAAGRMAEPVGSCGHLYVVDRPMVYDWRTGRHDRNADNCFSHPSLTVRNWLAAAD